MLPEHIRNPDSSIYKKGSHVIIDFETTNLDKGDALNKDNNLVMAYWLVVDRDGSKKGRYCFADDIAQSKLVSDIQEADFLVAHNAKFELQWLYRCGLDLRSVVVYDTMIAEYVISGNRKRSLSLDATAKRYGLGAKEGLVAKMIKQGICPSTIHADWLKAYCKQDVLLTDKVFKAQLEWIDSNYPRLLNIVYTRCLLTPVLADIERNGMTLDAERVEATRTEYLQKLAEVDEKLYEINPDINWNSPKQKAEFLYDELGFNELTDFRGEVIRTPSGGRKTDSDTIQALHCTTEIQRVVVSLIKERNKYAAALSKNLDFFYGVCREYGGVFRGVFNQCVTSTHRLSSSGRKLNFACLDGKEAGAQFQNLPREFKSLFKASGKDRVIGEIDGSQLEFRVAGHLGRDEQVYYDVTHEVDIHAFTAEELTAAGEPTSRQDAKASTFRPLYGGRSGTPAVQAYCQAFREKYKQLSDVQFGWATEASDTKRLETEWGMVYYFPYAEVTKSGYITDSTKIYNFPIQAFATAEIIPIALVFFWHMIKDTDIVITNTVHDSIICDMPRGSVAQFAKLGTESMINNVYQYLRDMYEVEMYVPLGIGIKAGDHWNEPDTRLAPQIIEGVQECGYEAINDNDEEIKADQHKEFAVRA